jgi:hypothetical protein
MQLRALAPIASILALTVTGAAALAGGAWTPVAQTAESVYLLDESSIERRADVLTAWELVEYAAPQYADGAGYRSQINLRAYRCSDRSWDVLRVTRYTGSLQSGEAVLSSSFSPAQMTWHRAAPDSVADFLLERVCALAGAGRAS